MSMTNDMYSKLLEKSLDKEIRPLINRAIRQYYRKKLREYGQEPARFLHTDTADWFEVAQELVEFPKEYEYLIQKLNV